ncbi:hypothetical protein Tcan_01369, partial [Toxocara canis]
MKVVKRESIKQPGSGWSRTNERTAVEPNRRHRAGRRRSQINAEEQSDSEHVHIFNSLNPLPVYHPALSLHTAKFYSSSSERHQLHLLDLMLSHQSGRFAYHLSWNSYDFIDFIVLSIDVAGKFPIYRDPELAASRRRHIHVAADLPILLAVCRAVA